MFQFTNMRFAIVEPLLGFIWLMVDLFPLVALTAIKSIAVSCG